MSDSFRTMQAVGDLVHHVKPLLARHLAAVSEASGLTLRETGEAFARLRDDGYWFQRDETLPLLDGLETIAITQAEGFDLAVVVLLADVLQRRQVSGLLTEAWAESVVRLRNWPATLRAAVANGLRRAVELGAITLERPPTDADCQTRQPAEIAEYLLQIARSMRREELEAVAQADYGKDVGEHLAGLQRVIREQDGVYEHKGDREFPGRVVNSTSIAPNEMGFPGCTAIVFINALRLGPRFESHVESDWENFDAAYSALPPSQRDPILAAFRHLYELDWLWDIDTDLTIPVVDQL